MNATDALLDRVTPVVLEHLAGHPVTPGKWTTQISLHFATRVDPHALPIADGRDPIAVLEEFGRRHHRAECASFVVVIAESVTNELMIACADSAGNANIAYLLFADGRWSFRSRHYCGRLDAAKLERHPAAAVMRGMRTPTATIGP
jgi:hypothetical protein